VSENKTAKKSSPKKVAAVETGTAQISTTPARLSSILKSARDIMRKDKGLNGDLDRLPLLTWIMFLKFLDDFEVQREAEATMGGHEFQPIIKEPYRWRDWAKELNPTGDELLDFINKDEVVNPFSTKKTDKIAGLFYYLRNIANDADASDVSSRRLVIATVFKGVDNVPAAALVEDDAIDDNKLLLLLVFSASSTATTNDDDGGEVTRGGDSGDFSVAVVAEADAATATANAANVIAGPVRGWEEEGDDGETTIRPGAINGATA